MLFYAIDAFSVVFLKYLYPLEHRDELFPIYVLVLLVSFANFVRLFIPFHYRVVLSVLEEVFRVGSVRRRLFSALLK